MIAVSLAKQKGVPHNEQALEQMLLLETNMPEIQQAINSEATFLPNPSSFQGYLLWGLASESTEADFATQEFEHVGIAVLTADYGEHILPIFETSCLDCHSSGDAAGQYALDTLSAITAQHSDFFGESI